MAEEVEEIDLEEIASQEEQEEIQEEPELSSFEKEQWDKGWRPEAEFEGEPDNWKTAKEYAMYGGFQDQLHSMKNDFRRKEGEFNTRISNLNVLHEQQQESTVAALKLQQRQAVEEADTERYDQLQTEIDTQGNIRSAQPVIEKDPLIVEWENNNTWINDPNDERTQQANAFLNIAALKPGATIQSSLKYVDEQLEKLHPSIDPVNPRREALTMTEQGTKPAPRKRNRDLTMNDLTRDEASQWQQFGSSMFKSEKDFLKAVSDARKE